MKHVFPKWFYHKEAFPQGKIIRSEAEFLAMPVGFVESYGDLDKEIEPVKPIETKIEEPKVEAPIEEPKEEKASVDFESLTQEELIVEAMKKGITKKKAKLMTKAEIIEHIKGAA